MALYRNLLLIIALFLVLNLITACGDNDKPTPPTPADPALSISPDSLTFGPTDNSRTITISNTGGDELNWEITTDSSWLSVNIDSGGVTTTPATITVSITRDSSEADTLTARLFINSNGGDDTVHVTVEPIGPVLSVSVNLINFSRTDKIELFTISNIGTGELTWEAFVDSSWVKLNVDSGTITTTPETVSVSLERDSMDIALLEARILFTSNGGLDAINVYVDNTIPLDSSYFPMAMGDTWYYTNDSGQSIVRTVEGDTTICFRNCTRIYHNGEIAEAWSIDDTGFYVHLLTGNSSFEVSPLLAIPFELPALGDYAFNSGVFVECNYQDFDIAGTLTFIDYTSKTVPAGTFDTVAELYYDPAGDDPEDPPYTEYYAPGVGLLDNGDLILDSAFIGGVWHR